MTVGMYHVITSMGGAGQQTAYLADTANITLYSVFLGFTLVAPACLNYFGIRATLCFGGLGYAAYAASLWCYNHTHNQSFVIFGGAWNGLSAAFLWVAERVGIVAYASEDKKGLYVAIFWTVYQVGTMVGSAIPVGQNWNAGTTNSSTVSDGTYIGLFILMLCGSAIALLLRPMDRVVREDGTRVALPVSASPTIEAAFLTLRWQSPGTIIFQAAAARLLADSEAELLDHARLAILLRNLLLWYIPV